MPVARTQILQGPAQVQWGDTTFYSKGDVTVALNVKEFNIMSEGIGLVDYRDDDVMADISFEPDGQVTTALIAALYPYIAAGVQQGFSPYGSTDTPLIIWCRDGNKHTFNNVAVTKQPPFIASAVKTAFGSVTFRALRSLATAWSGVDSLVTITNATYPGDGAYNLANIITSPVTARWFTGTVPTGTATVTEASPAVFSLASHGLAIGDTIINSGYTNPALNGTFTVAPTDFSSSEYTLYLYSTTTALNNTVGSDTGTFIRNNVFDSFTTESGFSIDSNATLSEVGTDDQGVIDMRFQQIEVTCKAIPVGPQPNDLINALAIQGTGAIRGRSRAAVGANLYLIGTGLYAKLTQASLIDIKPIVASSKKKRVQECTWKTTMTLTSGVPNPPFTLSTSAIS